MAKNAVHFSQTLGTNNTPRCGSKTAIEEMLTTTDPSLVTCKKCRYDADSAMGLNYPAMCHAPGINGATACGLTGTAIKINASVSDRTPCSCCQQNVRAAAAA